MSNFTPEHIIDVKEAYQKFQEAREQLSDETIIEQIQNYFDTDTFTWFLENLYNDYDLGLFDEED